MLAAGINSPVPLDELELHLREDIERDMKSGMNGREIFNLAVQKIGQAQELKTEFAKVNKLEGNASMKNSRIVSNLALAVVLVATVWLTHLATEIWTQTLSPKDGLVHIGVSEGAQVLVQHGAPVLQGEGTVSGPGEYHFALIPAVAVPFAVLVAFAIVGCRSMLRRQST